MNLAAKGSAEKKGVMGRIRSIAYVAAALELIDGVGHHVELEAPDRVAAALGPN